jgi:hypothetical protein
VSDVHACAAAQCSGFAGGCCAWHATCDWDAKPAAGSSWFMEVVFYGFGDLLSTPLLGLWVAIRSMWCKAIGSAACSNKLFN